MEAMTKGQCNMAAALQAWFVGSQIDHPTAAPVWQCHTARPRRSDNPGTYLTPQRFSPWQGYLVQCGLVVGLSRAALRQPVLSPSAHNTTPLEGHVNHSSDAMCSRKPTTQTNTANRGFSSSPATNGPATTCKFYRIR